MSLDYLLIRCTELNKADTFILNFKNSRFLGWSKKKILYYDNTLTSFLMYIFTLILLDSVSLMCSLVSLLTLSSL